MRETNQHSACQHNNNNSNSSSSSEHCTTVYCSINVCHEPLRSIWLTSLLRDRYLLKWLKTTPFSTPDPLWRSTPLYDMTNHWRYLSNTAHLVLLSFTNFNIVQVFRQILCLLCAVLTLLWNHLQPKFIIYYKSMSYYWYCFLFLNVVSCIVSTVSSLCNNYNQVLTLIRKLVLRCHRFRGLISTW